MSICSKSGPHNPECRACATNIRELIPNIDQLRAEAKAAGEHTCERCGFVYYKTVDSCPKCNRVR